MKGLQRQCKSGRHSRLDRFKAVSGRDGFTRLQQLMIFVLVLVLATVGIYSFMGYRRAAYQVKADRMAAKTFDIAQEYIKLEFAAGRRENFNTIAAHYGGVVRMEQQIESLKSRYRGSDEEIFLADYQKKYQNTPVYYIKMEGIGSAGEEREDNPLLKMFEYQLVDENITRQTFLVEYNGNTGQVLSVFYSERAENFTYDGKRESENNVILRDEKSLNQKWQGYCGVELEEL